MRNHEPKPGGATAFLVRFSDIVRGLVDPTAVGDIACRMLVDELRAERSHWAEVDWATREYVIECGFAAVGAAAVPNGRYPVDEWEPVTSMLLAGRTLLVENTATDPRFSAEAKERLTEISATAQIAVPVMVNGQLHAVLAVHQGTPRRWTPQDIALVEGVATRCWAEVERARAEDGRRESEQRMRLAIRATRMVTWEWVPAEDRITTSHNFSELYGLPALAGAEEGFALVLPEDKESHIAKVRHIAAGGGTYDSDFRIRRPVDGRIVWLEERAEAQLDSEGRVQRVTGVTLDITERKRAEQTLRENDARNRFLLALSDRLSTLTDANAIRDASTELLGRKLAVAHCHYSEYDVERGIAWCSAEYLASPDLPSMKGTIGLAPFVDHVASFTAGKILVQNDLLEDEPAEGARSYFASIRRRSQISVPIVRGGKLIATLTVSDTEPRQWSEIDVAVVADTAHRTWAAFERARTEAALRESEAKYRSVFDIIDDAYALFEVVRDDGGAIVDYWLVEANAAWERLTGIPLSTLLGRRRSQWAQAVPSFALALIADSIETATPVRFERYIPSFGGWFDVQFVPRGERFVNVFVDITARKKAERALRESEERQSFLLKLSDAIRQLSEPIRIQQSALQLLGKHMNVPGAFYFGAERDAEGWHTVIDNDYHRPAGLPTSIGRHAHSAFGVGVLAGLEHGEDVIVEDVLAHREITQEQGERYVGFGTRAFVASPILKDGVFVGGICVWDGLPRAWTREEVTLVREVAERTWAAAERARAEVALRTSEARLQLADRAKDEFLATLGHELRTPLTAITLWGGALRSGNVPLQEFARAIDAIVESASVQSRLIDDLLDLTRLMTGKLLLAPESVVVEDIARAIVDAVRPSASEKNLSLRVETAPDLGRAVLDAARLRQVLWNLLSNAIKFTPVGGTVTLRMHRIDGCLEAQVADNGEGIAPEFFPHLFERFRQADMRETRQHGGLGIGLALSRQLLELQGGTISAHSEGRGRGATFTLRLPWIDG